MTTAAARFDRWIRNEFVEYNTALEEAYFAERQEILHGRPGLDELKQALVAEGHHLIGGILAEGALPVVEREKYQLLGLVGYHLAACRRHESVAPGAEQLSAAWSLASLLGSSLGVAPRFVFAHQAMYNPASGGQFQTFTSLEDEAVFLTNNGLAVFAYQRAAEAIRQIAPIGVSSPLSAYLLETALAALEDVLQFNRTLSKTLDVERFFFNVRPYFKTYRVGNAEYRGANAGDFSAINELDVLLGLASTRDPFYQNLVTEKYPYVTPADQVRLRAIGDEEPLLTRFLREAEATPDPRLRKNAELFLAVCRAHGAAYTYHHHKLVLPFLVEPAKTAPPERLSELTASGPPLDVVVSGLSYLADLRAARDRPGKPSARKDLDRLREWVSTASGDGHPA
ncbi:monodechloroaminopyrrolnitrin synthase PrnB family protein [Amycolatopsis rhabdoformis]|uniref:Monodechloroaminopyrrolnitrin synthase PrnB family protein n=1 Tax=Amycolatopsis rhabdoformis TaxID=1448059 RepID=A0ABZ1I5S7_9PSEU|nr:monodechloroaminopyrrolnitrin synthase PrnB family protein [Amycolatopsis rhabdoformis]WSE29776.1 monodechloroaminopyrrolnitrin synthase PrnB family protein [Amycolatopsis rhabdoformis]